MNKHINGIETEILLTIQRDNIQKDWQLFLIREKINLFLDEVKFYFVNVKLIMGSKNVNIKKEIWKYRKMGWIERVE